jgi:hypothetical protein
MKVPSLSLLLCLAGCATGNSLAPDRDGASRAPSFDGAQTGSRPSSLDRALSPADPSPPESSSSDSSPDWSPDSSPVFSPDWAPAPEAQGPQRGPSGPRWRKGQALQQGYIGVTTYDKIERDGGRFPNVDGDRGNLDEMFMIGGGGQWKLNGEGVDFGLEGFLQLQGRGNAEAFVIGGGGAAVAVDVDLFIFDFYGGPMISTFLGDSVRIYAGAGPTIGWAFYDQAIADGSGFGYGWYARTGLELVLGRFMLGGAARWTDSHYDLGGGLGDVDVKGFQWMITFTTGL